MVGSRLCFGRFGPTDPAGNPSLRGRPTGRLIFVGVPSKFFFELPLGRPGRRLTGSEGLPSVETDRDGGAVA